MQAPETMPASGPHRYMRTRRTPLWNTARAKRVPGDPNFLQMSVRAVIIHAINNTDARVVMVQTATKLTARHVVTGVTLKNRYRIHLHHTKHPFSRRVHNRAMHDVPTWSPHTPWLTPTLLGGRRRPLRAVLSQIATCTD